MTGKVRWTDDMKFTLAKELSQCLGYMKTADSMEVKWTKISDAILKKPAFQRFTSLPIGIDKEDV